MDKFCSECGSKLDKTTKLCPNCDKDIIKSKKRKIIRKRITSAFLAIVLIASGLGGYFGLTYQTEFTINDKTQAAYGQELTEDNGAGGDDDSQTAVLNPSVKVYSDDIAATINSQITELTVKNSGVYFTIPKECELANLGIGDLFYLPGDVNTPFGQVYIGKVVQVRDKDTSLKIKTTSPSIDEAFDKVNIDTSGTYTAQNITEIKLCEGVSVEKVSNVSEQFEEVKSIETPTTTNLKYTGNSVNVENTEVTVDDLLLTVEIDLLEGLDNINEKNSFSKKSNEAAGTTPVYVTDTGHKYHNNNCKYLHSSKTEKTLSDATEGGYTPCSICKPPILMGDSGSKGSIDQKAILTGKIGFSKFDFEQVFDWDILNGCGPENISATAKGNFLTSLSLDTNLDIKIGADKTSYSFSDKLVELEGLSKKLFPIAYIKYDPGTKLKVQIGDSVYEKQSLNIGAMIYTDINGEITVDASANVAFNYKFNGGTILVENGEWVKKTSFDGSPSLTANLDLEASGFVDGHIGLSIMVFLFNLNVMDLSIAKVGAEVEGALIADADLKVNNINSDTQEEKLTTSIETFAFARSYVKLIDLNINIQGKIYYKDFIDLSKEINFHYLLLDKTIASWGNRSDTSYCSDSMSYTNITASDNNAIYYKNQDGKLIREANGSRQIIFNSSFFIICGIDQSYIYVLVPENNSLSLYRVAKNGISSRKITDNVKKVLLNDETSLYYTTKSADNEIRKLNRETLDMSNFAKFDDEVIVMLKTLNSGEFYVASGDNNMDGGFWGLVSTTNYHIINRDGKEVEKAEDISTYRININGYEKSYAVEAANNIRTIVSSMHMTPSVTNEKIKLSGRSFHSINEGILAQDGSVINLYSGTNGTVSEIATDLNDRNAVFTFVKDSEGNWYFFDKTDTQLLLYTMDPGFSNLRLTQKFDLDKKMASDLKDCSTTMMNNTIYFYTITDEKTCNVLYRFSVLSQGA